MSIGQNPLTVFQQYGFKEETKNTDGHSIGTCPFCQKKDSEGKGKFFVNTKHENKTWDCKICGRSGGYHKFLQTMVELSTKNPDFEPLAKDRRLKEETLKYMGIGFTPSDDYIVPVYSWDKSQILNIKIYDGASFKNTAGCQAAMYGLWLLPRKEIDYDTIFVTEGEWDTIALIEIFRSLKINNAAVIGVPGAGTFKNEAIQYFIGKHVYLLYDNDLAGKNGSKKAISILASVASKIDELAWPEGTPPGFDVRDVYTKQFKCNPKQAFDWLKAHCQTISLQQQDASVSVESSVKVDPIPVKEVYDTFRKWILLGDNKSKHQKGTDIYDIVFGTILANRIPGSPVWMYIVAPPGGYKTEPLLACSGGKLIEMVESVTPAALISGLSVAGHADPSLIAKIHRKTLIVKDWTILLGLPEHEVREIMGILRGSFDGECGRNFGNGIRRVIKSTFGILAAVTPVIEQYIEQTSAVGERFVSWRNWISEDQNVRKEHIRRALSNVMHETTMKTELNTIAKKVLLAQYPEPPRPNEAVTEQIISMSEWIAAMRGAVSRDKYSKAITHRPCTEIGTRVSKEIMKWLMGVSLFKGEKVISSDSLRVAEGIARSSVSQRNFSILQAMWKDKEKWLNKSDVEKEIHLPSETSAILLGNMVALNILERDVQQNKSVYRIKKQFITLTEESKVL
jgi:hypothetical protein